jgi:hypothetical protein
LEVHYMKEKTKVGRERERGIWDKDITMTFNGDILEVVSSYKNFSLQFE